MNHTSLAPIVWSREDGCQEVRRRFGPAKILGPQAWETLLDRVQLLIEDGGTARHGLDHGVAGRGVVRSKEFSWIDDSSSVPVEPASLWPASQGAEPSPSRAIGDEICHPPCTCTWAASTGRRRPEMLDYFKRHGVEAICGYPPVSPERGYWTREDLEQTRDLCEKHGIALDMVALPLLSSSHIDREKRGGIMLAEEPERDRDIERIQKMIAACDQAGSSGLQVQPEPAGRLADRPDTRPGRLALQHLAAGGGPRAPPADPGGQGHRRFFWERITYFLQRIIPVCNEHKVRAACHPHDPGVPPAASRASPGCWEPSKDSSGSSRSQESPYHGLNFCVGTVAEMLDDPAQEIHEVIRYFGQPEEDLQHPLPQHPRPAATISRRSSRTKAIWTWSQVARTLQEVGYPYMVMPDHCPSHPDDPRASRRSPTATATSRAFSRRFEAMVLAMT